MVVGEEGPAMRTPRRRLRPAMSGLHDDDEEGELEMYDEGNCDDRGRDRFDVKILRGRGLRKARKEAAVIKCHVVLEGEEVGSTTAERTGENATTTWSGGNCFEDLRFGELTELCVQVRDEEAMIHEARLRPYAIRDTRRARGDWYPNAWYAAGDADLELQILFYDEKPGRTAFVAKPKSMRKISLAARVRTGSDRSSSPETVDERFLSDDDDLDAAAASEKKKKAPRRRRESAPGTTQGGFSLSRLTEFVWGTEKEDAIFNLIKHATSPVFLHVYDLGTSTLIAGLNRTTEGLGGGVFHAAVEVAGREFSYGGCSDPGKSGVFACRPRRCPVHTYRESVYLGDSGLSNRHVAAVVDRLKPKFLGLDYDLLRFNCCTFAREFAILLGVGDIPKWVDRLAENVGSIIDDALPFYTTPSRTEDDHITGQDTLAAAAGCKKKRHSDPRGSAVDRFDTPRAKNLDDDETADDDWVLPARRFSVADSEEDDQDLVYVYTRPSEPRSRSGVRFHVDLGGDTPASTATNRDSLDGYAVTPGGREKGRPAFLTRPASVAETLQDDDDDDDDALDAYAMSTPGAGRASEPALLLPTRSSSAETFDTLATDADHSPRPGPTFSEDDRLDDYVSTPGAGRASEPALLLPTKSTLSDAFSDACTPTPAAGPDRLDDYVSTAGSASEPAVLKRHASAWHKASPVSKDDLADYELAAGQVTECREADADRSFLRNISHRDADLELHLVEHVMAAKIESLVRYSFHMKTPRASKTTTTTPYTW